MSLRLSHIKSLTVVCLTAIVMACAGEAGKEPGKAASTNSPIKPSRSGGEVEPTRVEALFEIAATTEDLSLRINRRLTADSVLDVVVYESANKLYFLESDGEEAKQMLIVAESTICSMSNAYFLDQASLQIVEKLEVVLELNDKDCSAENRSSSFFRSVTFNQFGGDVDYLEPTFVAGSSTWFLDIDERTGTARAGTIKFEASEQILRLLDEDLSVLWQYEFEDVTSDFEAYYVNDRLTLMRQNNNIFVRAPKTVLAARSAQDLQALFASPNYQLMHYPADSSLLCWSSNGDDIVLQDGDTFYQYNETTEAFEHYAGPFPGIAGSCQFNLQNDGSLLLLQNLMHSSGQMLQNLSVFYPSLNAALLLVRDEEVNYRIVDGNIYVNSANSLPEIVAYYFDASLIGRSFPNSKWMHIQDQRTDTLVPLMVTAETIRLGSDSNELLLERPTVNVFDLQSLDGKGFYIGQITESVTIENSSGVIASNSFGILNLFDPENADVLSYFFDPRSPGSATKQ